MKTFFLILFLALSTVSLAKTKTLTITVVDGMDQKCLPGITVYQSTKKDNKLLGKTNSAGTLVVLVKSSSITVSVYDPNGKYERTLAHYKFSDNTNPDTLKIECFPKSNKEKLITEAQHAEIDQKYDLLGMPVEDSVDQEAEFYGGKPRLMKTINANLTLPDNVIDQQISTKVIVKFIIEADGTVTHVEIVQGSLPEVNTSVINLVYNLPAYKPAVKNGKTVRSAQQFPITISSQ